jgi:hypothetical protein
MAHAMIGAGLDMNIVLGIRAQYGRVGCRVLLDGEWLCCDAIKAVAVLERNTKHVVFY